MSERLSAAGIEATRKILEDETRPLNHWCSREMVRRLFAEIDALTQIIHQHEPLWRVFDEALANFQSALAAAPTSVRDALLADRAEDIQRIARLLRALTEQS